MPPSSRDERTHDGHAYKAPCATNADRAHCRPRSCTGRVELEPPAGCPGRRQLPIRGRRLLSGLLARRGRCFFVGFGRAKNELYRRRGWQSISPEGESMVVVDAAYTQAVVDRPHTRGMYVWPYLIRSDSRGGGHVATLEREGNIKRWCGKLGTKGC